MTTKLRGDPFAALALLHAAELEGARSHRAMYLETLRRAWTAWAEVTAGLADMVATEERRQAGKGAPS